MSKINLKNKFKVDYITEDGTQSDNEFIGIFDTYNEALEAKNNYAKEQCGDDISELSYWMRTIQIENL